MGGPDMAPQTPPTFGAPRGTRGAPLYSAAHAAISDRRSYLLLFHHEVRAAVLRPARLGVVRALWLFLAVRDDRDAPGLYALRGEIVLRRLGAALAEREVVSDGAPLVAVALDQHEVPWVRLQPRRVGVPRPRGFRREIVPVELELDVGKRVGDAEPFD